MNPKTQQISQLILKAVHAVEPDAEVVLYGSRARSEESPESDWDILILTHMPVSADIEDNLRDKLYDVELETGESLSTFIYSKSDWASKQRITPFYQNVSTEGILL